MRYKDILKNLRSCLDFIANKFEEELLLSVKLLNSAEPASSLCSRRIATFGLFEVIFGTFILTVLANRPLFAASREYKSAQKFLSTKLEIKSKQLLNQCANPYGGSSSCTLKQGQALFANSLWPWTVAFGNRFFKDFTRPQSTSRCSGVLVSRGLPLRSVPPM